MIVKNKSITKSLGWFTKYLLLFSALITSLLCLFCDENPVNGNNTQPGRRDYTWTIDSIDYEGLPTFIELKSIWGSSPNDVWGSHFTADVRNCLWHYDGTAWKRAVEGTPITDPSGGSSIVGGVWGTVQNDVWAFGGTRFSNPEREAPFVMHFNGAIWTEVLGDTSKMPDGYWDVFGVGKDHFWIASAEDVFRYKFGVWERFFIRDTSVISSIAVYGDDVYLTDYLIGVDSLFLYKLSGNSFKLIDQTNLINGKFGAHGLIVLRDKAFTFNENGIYSTSANNGEIDINGWTLVVSTSSPNGLFNSFVRNERDIWAVGYNNFPYHYNGTNWKEIDIFIGNSPPGFQSLFGVWGDGNEIFICDDYNEIIYHGR
jgi:hypothetical protein